MNSDHTAVSKAFNDAVIDTFAEMAFVDVIPEQHYEGEIPYTSIFGLDFSSPGKGHILFYMSKECKKQLVENIYGEEWVKLNDLEIDDCLLEILNVLAGVFLKNLYGRDKKVQMSFPRIYFDDEGIHGDTGELKFIYNAEGAMFHALVTAKE